MGKVKVFKQWVKGHSEGYVFKIHGTIRKVVSKGTHMQNTKALSLTARELWAMLKYFKSRLKITVEGQVFKIYCSTIGEVLSKGTHMQNTKALSLMIRKLRPILKFLTDRPTDRVITIGHLSSGGGLITFSFNYIIVYCAYVVYCPYA